MDFLNSSSKNGNVLVATVQPHDAVVEQLEALLEIGFGSFRVNFGRGTLDANVQLIELISSLCLRRGGCTLFVDLPGRKARLGMFENGSENIVAGQSYILDTESNDPGGSFQAPLESKQLYSDASRGDILGTSSEGPIFEVTAKRQTSLLCRVVKGGRLYNRRGIFIAGKYRENTTLTSMDVEILKHVDDSVSFVCPSFSDNTAIVSQVRDIAVQNHNWQIVAKIESPYGVQNMADIAKAADGLMLCRGDLQTFYSIEELEEVGASILNCGRSAGKAVVYATDYFADMERDGVQSKDGACTAARAFRARPDFLILNETSASDHWRQIALTAMSLARTFARTESQ